MPHGSSRGFTKTLSQGKNKGRRIDFQVDDGGAVKPVRVSERTQASKVASNTARAGQQGATRSGGSAQARRAKAAGVSKSAKAAGAVTGARTQDTQVAATEAAQSTALQQLRRRKKQVALQA